MTVIFSFNALRQLYELSSHPGVEIKRWIAQNQDQQPSRNTSTTIPQLTLNTTGGPLVEIHPYGVQAAAQVYGTITATQEILDSAAVTAQSYPWVRYYARRFGDTTVPLRLDSTSITGVGLSVSITPTEFDALEEIVDGWKEVTLRFITAPTMGSGTNPQWRWSASGETAGNRWEVLGAIAPALSGTPGNQFTLTPSPHQLGTATYGAPSAGTTINMGWMPQYAPPVSAPSDDQTTDAVLLFAQDMPGITGFGSTNEQQELVGIGLDCGINPCCIPSAIDFIQLTWGASQGMVVSDTFERTVANSWGTADTDQTYTNSGGVVGSYNVLNGYGQHTMTSATPRVSYIFEGWTDIDVYAEIRVDQLATGAEIIGGLVGRLLDADNTFFTDVLFGTDQSITIRVRSRIAGSSATLASYTTGFVHDVTAWYSVRYQIIGQLHRAKIWITGDEEPDIWQVQAGGVTATYTTGSVGTRSAIGAGNTNTNPTVHYDNFYASPLYLAGAKYEIQRMDTVETEWKTIMLTENLSIQSFNDYEARVGIVTSYRVRSVDAYGFYGPWSSEVTATVPEPGVTIGCEGGHLLIFTSNEEQDGSLNLAYSSVWESGRTVEEPFVFPEARFVTLQAMYNRDYFTAFRTTERGGEQFARTVLVQAAAIAPETLGDFTDLRDMAWADVSYICVRDEEGNRWFATILVPGGRVVHNRNLYLAPIEIVEVTDTPTQVSP